jgi:hypothetical protein
MPFSASGCCRNVPAKAVGVLMSVFALDELDTSNRVVIASSSSCKIAAVTGSYEKRATPHPIEPLEIPCRPIAPDLAIRRGAADHRVSRQELPNTFDFGHERACFLSCALWRVGADNRSSGPGITFWQVPV